MFPVTAEIRREHLPPISRKKTTTLSPNDRPGTGHQDDNDDDLSPVAGVGGADQRPVFREWRRAVTASKRECQARRTRVLAHPDLAQRLTEPPLRLVRPECWNGYIPPRTLPDNDRVHCGPHGGLRCRDRPHRTRVNKSPIRRQLVEIATEAIAREGTS